MEKRPAILIFGVFILSSLVVSSVSVESDMNLFKIQSAAQSQDIQWNLIIPELSNYANLNSYASSDLNLDIHNWAKKSFHETYDYCGNGPDGWHGNGGICGNFDYIEEFEFDVPNDITIFSVRPKYYLANTDSKDNSYYFLVNILIFNFESDMWKSIYMDNNTDGGWRDERALLYMKPMFIKDGKID